MANPQLENGYTSFANELLEAIFKSKLSGTEIDIILVVARYTYGFKRKSHRLSTSFLAKAIGSSGRWVKKSLKALIENKVIIVVNSKTGVTSELMINKNYEEWNCVTSDLQDTSVLENTSDLQDTRPVANKTPVPVSFKTPKKEKIKEKSKENIYSEFFEKLWELYPRKRGKSSVSVKAKKELYAAGYEKVVSAIESYKKEIAGREERYILQGSTFFNGRWIDFVADVPCNELESKSTDTVFERFNGLDTDVFQQYRELGIIDDEGNIDLFLADEEQKRTLQKVGAL